MNRGLYGQPLGDGEASAALASGRCVVNSGAGYSFSGSSFADVDATLLKLTLVLSGAHRCLVVCTAECEPTASGYVLIDFTVDGVRQGGTFGITGPQKQASGGPADFTVGFAWPTDVLSPGSHTFKLQARSTSGTGFLYASSSFPLQFSVMEMYA